MTPQTQKSPATIRRAKPDDAPACGQICYDAFASLNRAHNFPPDFPDPGTAVGLLSMMFSHPGFYCVTAELDGRIAGSNCLDERSAIGGVGPITIDPNVQNRGVGGQLMHSVMERARERGCAGIRLVQAAFHNRSLSLYAKLGFDAVEPLSVMQGTPPQERIDGFTVRSATAADLEGCNRVCLNVHGHHRGPEMADAIQQRGAMVVERAGRITGYTSGMAFFGHSVSETNADMQALIAAAEGFGGPGILVPTRNSALFRWCLVNGLRVVEPMTLMVTGLYNQPAGAFLSSVLY
jgi:GNAT superfamily N-acetyltransferase